MLTLAYYLIINDAANTDLLFGDRPMLNITCLFNKTLLIFTIFAALYAAVDNKSDTLCSTVMAGSSAEAMLHTTLDALGIKSCE
ncbi:MAG: hypothetical protein ACI8WB_001197 [Phenylobacterium sp.]|jgi:hypothetical protein